MKNTRQPYKKFEDLPKEMRDLLNAEADFMLADFPIPLTKELDYLVRNAYQLGLYNGIVLVAEGKVEIEIKPNT